MANTPEGKVKDRVKRLLKKYNCYQFWPVQTGYGAPTLDCIGCHAGFFFSIETKAPGKHLTPRQSLTKEDMEEADARVFVIGEKRLYKKGEPKVGTGKLPEGKEPPAPKDIYSGMDELESWLLMTGRHPRNR